MRIEAAVPCRHEGGRTRLSIHLAPAWACALIACLLPIVGLSAPAAAQLSVGGEQATRPKGAAPVEPMPKLPLVPAGFVDEVILSGLDLAVGFTFAPGGLTYFWQKPGVVLVRPPEGGALFPFLDLQEEVAIWAAHGLMGFVLDPDFQLNGFVYLLYGVDHHHLSTFGTPGYDPDMSSPFEETIGRITRYTADVATGFTTVVPGSRLILLGESASSGIPLCSGGHSVGALAFGNDGTLLVSAGDGDSPGPASGTCFANGVTRAAEEVGAFRSQLVDSLSGKVLRIDPLSGDGLPSNPFWDPSAPRAARSRVWVMGLRNPYRFVVRPESGSTNPEDGRPGTLFIGDVGEGDYEELDVARRGGVNFGWPVFEGNLTNSAIGGTPTLNLDAPNPLFGLSIPGVGTCQPEFFDFQDLIVQDSLNPLQWTNPCTAGEPISTVPVLRHLRGAITWSHHTTATIPIFDGSGEAAEIVIDDPQSPVAGESFIGSASIGGSWYSGAAFPSTYRNTYFQGDYAAGWIRNFVFDNEQNLLEVREFAEPVGRIVHMEQNRDDGALYYLDYTQSGVADFRRIRYAVGNQAPQAQLDSSTPWGAAPLTVAFDATASTDPEGAPLRFAWDFGAGAPPSTAPEPVRSFPSVDITGQASQILAKVFELIPPMSMGTANDDPEVMRDGVFPLVGSLSLTAMYDTVHVDAMAVVDKDGEDYVGYAFPEPHTFTGVLFQEGRQYPGIGGWFATLSVQVRQGGKWVDATGLLSSPPYGGAAGPDYETYDLSFDPLPGDAIRLYGVAGGSLEFVTIGELRVVARPPQPLPGAMNIPVQLTATDIAGATGTDMIVVSLDNSPPAALIRSPEPFELYSTQEPQTFSLDGKPSDAETDPGDLNCAWQVTLHHNEHNHPGPILAGCVQDATMTTDGCPDIHYQEVRFLVTDPLGLTGEASRYLIPDCDQDLSGTADALEIAVDPSLDLNLDGVPDAAQTDCNGNGIMDLYELFFGLATDLDGDGLPDDCMPGFSGEVLRESAAGTTPGATTPAPGGSAAPPVDTPVGVGPDLPSGG